MPSYSYYCPIPIPLSTLKPPESQGSFFPFPHCLPPIVTALRHQFAKAHFFRFLHATHNLLRLRPVCPCSTLASVTRYPQLRHIPHLISCSCAYLAPFIAMQNRSASHKTRFIRTF